ncbi:RHS repeat-associated core domain-containing protein [Pseudomonas vancouverensis]|nr:RHS repeat-associated core domain-containing protein [Pseudomonas vancouverensis]
MTGLAFNGEFRDTHIGWYLLGNGYRAYNPTLMRFHSPDSLSPFGRGGLNAYMYCGGDPVSYSDPTGHMPLPKFIRRLLSSGPAGSPSPTSSSPPSPLSRSKPNNYTPSPIASTPSAPNTTTSTPARVARSGSVTRVGQEHFDNPDLMPWEDFARDIDVYAQRYVASDPRSAPRQPALPDFSEGVVQDPRSAIQTVQDHRGQERVILARPQTQPHTITQTARQVREIGRHGDPIIPGSKEKFPMIRRNR